MVMPAGIPPFSGRFTRYKDSTPTQYKLQNSCEEGLMNNQSLDMRESLDAETLSLIVVGTVLEDFARWWHRLFGG